MPKREPLRKCIACGEQKEKRKLLRVVRTPEGSLEIDTTGKKNGRGAYLCRDVECLQKAIKKNRLKAALKAPIPEEFYEELKRSMEE